MATAGLVCPDCGSSNIVDDALYSQAQMVCVDCGSVVSEGLLAADPLEGSVISFSRSTAVSKKQCNNLIKGVQRVRAICQILRVHADIGDMSQAYYNQAYQHQHFINVSLHKKHILAGCCVLVSCRLHNWPITMATIGYLVDADMIEVGRIYQEMLKILSIEAPIFSINDVMETHINDYKISLLEVSEELAENLKDLTKRAAALAEMAAASWIVTGRKPAPIMMAATYLAWQSLKPSKLRLGLSLNKFCLLTKVKLEKPALKRIAEMKEMLCKLGRELPWVKDAVSAHSIVQHIEDILQYRNTLLRKALRNHENTLMTEGHTSSVEGPSSVESTPIVPIHPTASVEESQSRFQRKEQSGDVDSGPSTLSEHREGQRKEEPILNWGKRELFAPPCVIHCKKRRVQSPQLKDVTGDEEISDSEIDSYIRTPQEVQEFASSQMVLSSLGT
ncbi:transcription factor IIIB 50 kDa subunit [Gouania willdenowi]|uniref:Transcription factor IIIB 50 kDa subunit n=1 Tax=Gouania willdenowi TaxID=441366 RepID=A0A8C5HDT8_GOUWI|nr:transcription factor IIIB 50 kDa subunit [Gouania willdenowi]